MIQQLCNFFVSLENVNFNCCFRYINIVGKYVNIELIWELIYKI